MMKTKTSDELDDLESARLTRKVARLRRQMRSLYGREGKGIERVRVSVTDEYARCLDEIAEFERQRQARAERS